MMTKEEYLQKRERLLQSAENALRKAIHMERRKRKRLWEIFACLIWKMIHRKLFLK